MGQDECPQCTNSHAFPTISQTRIRSQCTSVFKRVCLKAKEWTPGLNLACLSTNAPFQEIIQKIYPHNLGEVVKRILSEYLVLSLRKYSF
jgi:hypothetical protein